MTENQTIECFGYEIRNICCEPLCIKIYSIFEYRMTRALRVEEAKSGLFHMPKLDPSLRIPSNDSRWVSMNLSTIETEDILPEARLSRMRERRNCVNEFQTQFADLAFALA